MAIYGISYINESTENNQLKSAIDKYKAEIKKNTNSICKDVFKNFINKDENAKDEFPSCPSFDSVKLIDGYYWIIIKNISEDTYASGMGLDFERDVARSLNKGKLGDVFKFTTEDYPGILIELRQ